jgi:hypothetical protein
VDNHTIAEHLATHARELEREGDNLYRVQAYRRAVATILGFDEPLENVIARRGRQGLKALPGIGPHLAIAIERLVRTGQFRTLIPESVTPEQHVSSLPGVGPALTALLADRLGVATIAELAAADRDGRLGGLGLGTKRLQNLRAALARHDADGSPAEPPRGEPPVSELLKIDQEYRRQAAEGLLTRIAPRRFNPQNECWLPLLYTRRDAWRYRALFSNTALAHRLGRTHDWVVIYFDGDGASGQRTVVTETRGDLRGRRVVRGREAECRAYYDQTARAG